MNYQELHAVAEREIRTGLFDRDVMRRAEIEAAGKSYLVHENYWRLRAASLAAEARAAFPSDPDAYLRQLEARLDSQQNRFARIMGYRAWAWTCVAFVSGASGAVALSFARGALRRHSAAGGWYASIAIIGGILGAVCIGRLRAIERKRL